MRSLRGPAGTKAAGAASAAASRNCGASVPELSSTQLCPIENFGVVPRLTSVTVSFSPGFAVISVRLNFIVSVAVISMARPSWAVAAGGAAAGVEAGPAGVEVESAAGGVEQPLAETAN